MTRIRNHLKKLLPLASCLLPSGGQSLVEVLVSLSVAAAVLSAITVGVIYSLRNAQFSKNQNLASQYAAQGMETVRQIRDNESTLASYNQVGYCLPQDSQTLIPKGVSCDQNVGQKDIVSNPQNIYLYRREVKIEPPQFPPTECGDNYKVTVKVSWWDNACGNTSNFCHKVNLVSCLDDRKNNAQRP